MLRYKFVEINPSTSGEKTVDALSGLGEKKRKIKQLFYVPAITASATPAKDGDRIRAYKNQEQIVDFCVDSFNLAVFSGIYFPDEIKPIDITTVFTQKEFNKSLGWLVSDYVQNVVKC